MKSKITIEEMAKAAYEHANQFGFHGQDSCMDQGHWLMQIVTELGECFEAHRKRSYAFLREEEWKAAGKMSDDDYKDWFSMQVKDTVEDELADAMIRIGDFAELYGIDIQKHVIAKMRFNELREFKHGKQC